MKNLKLLILILPFVFYSCGSTSENPIPGITSSFSATITGDVNSTFSGDAEFVHSILKSAGTGNNGSLLSIILENKNDSQESVTLGVFEIDNITGIKEGTYSYDINSTTGYISTAYSTTDGGYLFPDPALKNEIVITSVEGTRIKGSYTFNVSGIIGDPISATGTFDAVGVTVTN